MTFRQFLYRGSTYDWQNACFDWDKKCRNFQKTPNAVSCIRYDLDCKKIFHFYNLIIFSQTNWRILLETKFSDYIEHLFLNLKNLNKILQMFTDLFYGIHDLAKLNQPICFSRLLISTGFGKFPLVCKIFLEKKHFV